MRLSFRKRLAQRKETTRRLFELDAQNRCANCKRGITGTKFYLHPDPRPFCSETCRDEGTS